MTADDLAHAGLRCGTSVGPSRPVPLGSPLLGTQIELRNVDGTIIDSTSERSGYIWIGEFR